MNEEEIFEKVIQTIEFLTPEEVKGVLQGTLMALEVAHPGYTDHVVLGVLALRSGMDAGNPYGEENEN